MTIKTAIVGYGFSARTFHEPFFRHHEAFELVAVSGSNAHHAKAHWPAIQCFKTADQLFEQCDAELYVITTPNDSHFHLAKHLLEKGKNILIDKPVCTSILELKQLQTLEKAASTGSVSVFQNRRWDGDFLTLKQLLDEGRFGHIKRFESHFDRARPTPQTRWRELPGRGAGIWFDLGPHLIDQTLQLFGKPKAISADIKPLRENALVDDYFDATLHYSDKTVKINSSPFCYGRPLRFDVQGTDARFVKYGLDVQESKLISQQAFSTPNWAADKQEDFGEIFNDKGCKSVPTLEGCYRTFFDELAGFIRHQNPNPVDLDSIADQIKLLELGFESAQSGQRLAFN